MKAISRTVAAAALLVLSASAALAQSEPRTFRSADEAKRNMPTPPAECLDAGGRNGCVPLFVATDGEEGLEWLPGWGPVEDTYCVDAATADFEVDCDATDAMRLFPVPELCMIAPGAEPHCPSQRPPRRPD